MLPGYFVYDYVSRQLHAHRIGEDKPHRSWQLNEGSPWAVPLPSGGKVRISEMEMLLAALWTSNRAAMWCSGEDSKPLLRFVSELDANVYVL
jgi:hypothetical protein